MSDRDRSPKGQDRRRRGEKGFSLARGRVPLGVPQDGGLGSREPGHRPKITVPYLMCTVLTDTGSKKMPRSKRRSRKRFTRPWRGATPTARIKLPRVKLETILQVEDRRVYSPDFQTRPPGSLRKSHSRIKARAHTKDYALNFTAPQYVAICRRRKSRREVLFSLKIAGKSGVGRNKKRHTNFWSRISCR